MTNDQPLRVGLIGTGYIGTTVGGQFHHHPQSIVTAITEIDADRRATAAERFSVPSEALYEDYEEMIADASLDAILVGTPHTLHYEQIMAGLDANLHVFCDKPLATDLGHAKEIAERVAATNRTLMVGYQRHLNPAFISARERFADSEPTWITAEITQDWLPRFTDTWRTDPDLSGGGMLYDTGSHLLDGLLWTSGLEPTAVFSRMEFVDDERRVDSEATVLIEFANGATANVSVSGDLPCVREHIHLWNDEGAVSLDGRQWEPRSVTDIDTANTEHVPYIDHDEQVNKAEAFLTTIEEGSTPPATVHDALRVTAVTEAAYESARAGEWVGVDLD
ncbi:Gfo/Idh/MocA family protein [Halococcus thailandensis]|uniref:Oxidoreductase domain-containing protein n=1 Tax=Halococcus thailandensis JCM 13552 TaxID=1227457 RepID=M0MUY4_9EURY|nr:Gfo/Idh/MocA family oxidoreductase [Halococcus thailandensis]EMA49537.1 oxidoreductase domain-containing protein [Halococcus thailandensis JCM 13552]